MPAFAPPVRTPWRAMSQAMRGRAVQALSEGGRSLVYVAKRLMIEESELRAWVEKHMPLPSGVDDSGVKSTHPRKDDSSWMDGTRPAVHLLDVRETECRFPLWSGMQKVTVAEMFYCGAPKASAVSPYCPQCERLAFVPVRSVKKRTPPSEAVKQVERAV